MNDLRQECIYKRGLTRSGGGGSRGKSSSEDSANSGGGRKTLGDYN